jgi:hypothetical protein
MKRDKELDPDASDVDVVGVAEEDFSKWPCTSPLLQADGTERALVNNWRCSSCKVVLVGLPDMVVNV